MSKIKKTIITVGSKVAAITKVTAKHTAIITKDIVALGILHVG